MIDMLGVRWPKTAMIVWMRAPPSASWVPMVCRNRCAVIIGRPDESTSPAVVQAALSDKVEQECVRQQLAAHQEHMLHRSACAGIESRASILPPGQIDHRLQGFGGLGVQRDHALGVAW